MALEPGITTRHGRAKPCHDKTFLAVERNQGGSTTLRSGVVWKGGPSRDENDQEPYRETGDRHWRGGNSRMDERDLARRGSLDYGTQLHTNPGGKYVYRGQASKFHTNPGGKYVYPGYTAAPH
jgi:hypothetical protein